MRKANAAQGSLEYLIIIAAVLAIAAVVVLFVTGSFGSTSSSANFAKCKEAASACYSSHLLSPKDPCSPCESACVDLKGVDILEGTGVSAVELCKAGNSSDIYQREQLGPECEGTETETCVDADGCAGTRTCADNVWGECVKTDPLCPAPLPLCGNGDVDAGEVCDGSNLNGETCKTYLGVWASGNLACAGDCLDYDTSGCVGTPPVVCGDGVPEGAEQCDDGNTVMYDGCSNCASDIFNSLLFATDAGVFEFYPNGTQKWNVTGIGSPLDAEKLANGNALTINASSLKVVEITPAKTIAWEYQVLLGESAPVDVDRLLNGNTLIAQPSKITEVNPSGGAVWTLVVLADGMSLSNVKDADRLANGNTLISMANDRGAIEVNSSGHVLWSFAAQALGADRLLNGNTLIASGSRREIFEVNSSGSVVGGASITGFSSDRPYKAQRVYGTANYTAFVPLCSGSNNAGVMASTSGACSDGTTVSINNVKSIQLLLNGAPIMNT